MLCCEWLRRHGTTGKENEINGKYVAYYRVSTKGQGRSGLGLEAQRAAVEAFVRGKGSVEREFKEVETGKNAARPQLHAALEHAKSIGATLVIAKLDRMSRDVEFVFALRRTGADFLALDLPEFNTMTLAVFAGVAQHEREMISQRTKAALAARKARGEKLGTPANLTREAREKGVLARQAKAREGNLRVYEMARDLRAQGMSYARIAERLDAYGQRGAKGGRIHPANVRRILMLYDRGK